MAKIFDSREMCYCYYRLMTTRENRCQGRGGGACLSLTSLFLG